MQPNAAPDIYLMKREKSRAGCMTALIATVVALALAGAFALVHWLGNRGTEIAVPVEFPVDAHHALKGEMAAEDRARAQEGIDVVLAHDPLQ